MAKKAKSEAETPYVRSVREEWKRSQIKMDPGNPRYIDPTSRKKLRQSIKKYGLVGGLTVDRKTGELIGGHQRLGIVDDLHKQAAGKNPVPDFLVPVDVVELTEKERKAFNVLLNNPGAQGQFEFGKLASLLEGLGTAWEETGFDRLELEHVFSFAGTELKNSLFGITDERKEETEALANIKTDARSYVSGVAGMAGDSDVSRNGRDGSTANPNSAGKAVTETTEQRNERMNDKRHGWRDKQDEINSPDFLLEVVFNSEKELTRFLRETGLNEQEKYISGSDLAQLCGVELAEPEPTKKRRKTK